MHCSYWNQACVCAFLSSSTPHGRRHLLLLPSSFSRHVRVYTERARYADRPSNRDATRVKSTPSPRRCASERARAGVASYGRAIKSTTYASVGISRAADRLSVSVGQNGSRIFRPSPRAAIRRADDRGLSARRRFPDRFDSGSDDASETPCQSDTRRVTFSLTFSSSFFFSRLTRVSKTDNVDELVTPQSRCSFIGKPSGDELTHGDRTVTLRVRDFNGVTA